MAGSGQAAQVDLSTLVAAVQALTQTNGLSNKQLNSIAQSLAAIAAPVLTLTAPGGRLSFSSDPRPTAADSEAVTAVNYVSYIHNYVPIWNGTAYKMTALPPGGLTNNYSDATTNPAAVVAWECYDLFIWSNAGTLTLSRGTAYGPTGTRVAPVMQSGFLVNGAAITNGPGNGFGTYVGTIGTYNATSYMRLGQNSVSGVFTADALCQLWNQYNRLPVNLTVGSAGQGAVSASGVAGANGWFQLPQRVWIVSGDVVPFAAACSIDPGTATTYWGIGLGANPNTTIGVYTAHLALNGSAPVGAWVPCSGTWSIGAGQLTLAPQSNVSAASAASMWMPLTVQYEC